MKISTSKGRVASTGGESKQESQVLSSQKCRLNKPPQTIGQIPQASLQIQDRSLEKQDTFLHKLGPIIRVPLGKADFMLQTTPCIQVTAYSWLKNVIHFSSQWILSKPLAQVLFHFFLPVSSLGEERKEASLIVAAVTQLSTCLNLEFGHPFRDATYSEKLLGGQGCVPLSVSISFV